jgi:hypothetical protein
MNNNTNLSAGALNNNPNASYNFSDVSANYTGAAGSLVGYNGARSHAGSAVGTNVGSNVGSKVSRVTSPKYVNYREVRDPQTGQITVLTGKKAKETVNQSDMKKLLKQIDVTTITEKKGTAGSAVGSNVGSTVVSANPAAKKSVVVTEGDVKTEKKESETEKETRKTEVEIPLSTPSTLEAVPEKSVMEDTSSLNKD